MSCIFYKNNNDCSSHRKSKRDVKLLKTVKTLWCNLEEKQKWCAAAIAICFLFQLLYYGVVLDGWTQFPDTESYLSFDSMLQGGRTPVYVLFLWLFSPLKHNMQLFGTMVVLVQSVLSFLCIPMLFEIVFLMTKRNILSFFIGVFYGCLPGILNFNYVLLTESLSISGFVLLVFLLIKFFQKKTAVLAFSVGLAALVLVLLRPSYLFLIVLLGGFWILWFFLGDGDMRPKLFGLLGTGLALAGVLLYCGQNYIRNGFFGLSSVVYTNQMCMLVQADALENERYPDISSFAQSAKEASGGDMWAVRDVVWESFPDKYREYVSDTMSVNFVKFLCDRVERTLAGLQLSFPTCYAQAKFWGVNSALNEMLFPWSLMSVIMLVIIEFLYGTFQWVYRKSLCWPGWGLALCTMGIVGTTVLGAQEEWQRLWSAAIPCILILLAMDTMRISNLLNRKNSSLSKREKGFRFSWL